MGGRGSSSGMGSNFGPVGESSPNGEMKKVIAYHGSFDDFDSFDFSKKTKEGVDRYGEGFYFASTPEAARLYGDKIYEVEISYSTDRRTAKKTGREKDFTYIKDNGYWIIPSNKSKNIRIISKKQMNNE